MEQFLRTFTPTNENKYFFKKNKKYQSCTTLPSIENTHKQILHVTGAGVPQEIPLVAKQKFET